jgi:aspartyl-tRNA(Asn)/glutamyl-tRNA(Gln) amidotransferase subunit B
VAEWFDAAVAAGAAPQTAANWITNDLFRLMNEANRTIDRIDVTPSGLVKLLALVDAGTINAGTARDVLARMVATGRAAADIVAEQGLGQISDEAALAAIVAEVVAGNPRELGLYREGKTTLKGWFVGQVMRATRGQANPALVNTLVERALAQPGADPA